jgi:DnaJ-class molecular chaperone
MTSYYDILQINNDATQKQIKEAYKKLAIQYHPTKTMTNKKKAEEMFAKIAEAYSILSDPIKRKTYDNSLYNKTTNLNNLNNFSGFQPFDIGNISPESIFNSIFGMATNNIFNSLDMNGINNVNKQKGKPIEHLLNCTLEDLFYGKIKKYNIKRTIIDNNKSYIQNQIIQVEVKPGSKDGERIVFENLGDETPDFTPGDIIFVIKEQQHTLFKRKGNDLYTTITIKLYEAINGFQRMIKLINNTDEIINVNPFIISNEKYIIQKGGMPITNDKSNMIDFGNLIIKFIIILKN